MAEGWRALRVEDLERVDVAGVHWRPLRRTLGISAFGTNAYTGDAGACVVEPHDERGGHEELYVVLHGHARFTLGEEEVDAPQGTVVFVGDAAVRRQAVATQDGTAVLAVGGVPGAAGPPSGWEARFLGRAMAARGEAAAGARVIEEALADHPDDANVHLDLACVLALAGELDRAAAALERAIELDPRAATWAASEPDLDALRG